MLGSIFILIISLASISLSAGMILGLYFHGYKSGEFWSTTIAVSAAIFFLGIALGGVFIDFGRLNAKP